jgi:hypothetical protein
MQCSLPGIQRGYEERKPTDELALAFSALPFVR